MLYPTLPLSAVPVSSQLDPARQMPEIPPVAPVQPSSSEVAIDLRKDEGEREALLLYEEQQRQQRQKQQEDNGEPVTEHLAVPGHSLNADNTVPVVPLIDNEPRQGLWVDVEV